MTDASFSPMYGARRWARTAVIALVVLALAVAGGVHASNASAATKRAETATRAKGRAAGLACWKQSGTLRLCGALTDNYKRCYNTQVARETRSWLNWTAVMAKGATYRTAPGQPQFSSRLNLRRVRGSASMPVAAYITLRATQSATNVRAVTERTDYRTRRVGPLVDYKSMYSLSKRPIAYMVILRRTSDNRTLATASIAYRYEKGLAAAPMASPEHRGPGGRWIVNGKRTFTDVEAGTFGGC